MDANIRAKPRDPERVCQSLTNGRLFQHDHHADAGNEHDADADKKSPQVPPGEIVDELFRHAARPQDCLALFDCRLTGRDCPPLSRALSLKRGNLFVFFVWFVVKPFVPTVAAQAGN